MIPPVLCYHRIGGPLELGVTRTASGTFRRHMESLARAGWRTLTLAEFASSFQATHHAPRTFLLTFDDGYASLTEHAYPVLAELGFTATTFLITDYIGKTNTWDVRYTLERLTHLDWPAIESWRARSFDFGSHGASHQRLTWLDAGSVTREIASSRALLVDRLGAEAGRAIAYPFGATSVAIADVSRAAGFSLGFAGPRGDHADVMNLRRLPVYVWDLGRLPFVLRDDVLGEAARTVANVANRCAVGTSAMLRLRAAARGRRDTPERDGQEHRAG